MSSNYLWFLFGFLLAVPLASYLGYLTSSKPVESKLDYPVKPDFYNPKTPDEQCQLFAALFFSPGWSRLSVPTQKEIYKVWQTLQERIEAKKLKP